VRAADKRHTINQSKICSYYSTGSTCCVLRATCYVLRAHRAQQQDCRRSRRSSKREHGRVLPCSKHVHKRLTHEKSNRDTDRNRDHSTPDFDPVPGCCDRAPSGLRQTRLGVAKKKSAELPIRDTHDREGYKIHVPGPRRARQ
jgi:hypothetical protein